MFGEIIAIDANGEEAKLGKDVAKLKVEFNNNYAGLNVATYSEDSLMTTIELQNALRNEEGGYDYWKTVANFELPFTLDEPTAEELAEQYSYNSHYYDATAKQFIIVEENSVNIANLFATVPAGLGYSEVKVSNEDITFDGTNGTISFDTTKEKGKVYTISGATFTYLNGTFELPAMNIKFVNSKSFTLNTASANVSVQSGVADSEATVSYAEKATTTIKSFYNVKDTFNSFVGADQISSVKVVDFESPIGQTGNMLLEVPVVNDDKSITISATTEKASVDATATVKVKVTMSDNTELEGSFTVTVKAYPHN